MDIKAEADTPIELVAHYEGSTDLAPVYSAILRLDPPPPII